MRGNDLSDEPERQLQGDLNRRTFQASSESIILTCMLNNQVLINILGIEVLCFTNVF
jgi:hypothetical protein